MHGSNPGVAYQAIPGAYSEAAAGKAYPYCQVVPCDQFEVSFQAGVVDRQALTPGHRSSAMAAVGITAGS
ncbi:hypothetical protein F2Q70_00023364 [Brassica cretica]|uniref:Prephenate dehydratase n=1 Tax=Brassica cretica TaxID=69181 RepID=A0A8S9GWD5_BRACR|nr:hypothetical protein F2Q70_00023364 [Brassica cretica]KAF3590803.1 hypothetical protein DY000_02023065 [Brassica cretica]